MRFLFLPLNSHSGEMLALSFFFLLGGSYFLASYYFRRRKSIKKELF